MKICVLLAANMVGGGVKMPVRLASHLVDRHEVTVLYPRVPHYTTLQVLRWTSMPRRAMFVARELYRHRWRVVFEEDLDERVAVDTYFVAPASKKLRSFDAIIYTSVWQYHELARLNLDGVHRVHWTLADFLFCAGIVAGVNDIMQAYDGGDTLVAASERTRDDLERYGMTVRGVVPGGVDRIFHSDDRVNSSGRPKVLGYYQPAWWVKGGATMLQCLRQLRCRYPQLELSLFGHQRSDIARSGSSICDRFHTGLHSTEVADLLRAHDIFVYPSYSDGFQSPPLEAMACGCAVVATGVGAVPEYGVHERNMLICDPLDHRAMFDAVARLIDDIELRRRLGRQAAIDARRWTWEAAADKFDQLLRSLDVPSA